MKMYVLTTPLTRPLLDKWFLPTLKDDYEVVVEEKAQLCETGNFMSQGWFETMMEKVDLIIRGIKENFDGIIIHSDVDIQFFSKTELLIKKLIKNKDMLAQKDSPWGVLCAGFLVIRANEATLKLWEDIRELLNKKQKNDQEWLNFLLLENSLFTKAQHKCVTFLCKLFKGLKAYQLNTFIANPYALRWGYLPDVFWGPGCSFVKRWSPGMDLKIPREIVMHHANYTVGLENKLLQLEYVRAQVQAKQGKP